MRPCHICGRFELRAFASEVCFGKEGDLHREQCVDGGIGRLGMNPNWQRMKRLYPWMDKRR